MTYLKFILTVAFFLLAGLGVNTPSQANSSTSSSLKETLDQKIPGWLEQFNVPGVAIAFIENGEISWTESYGKQSSGVMANDQTLYNIASMTKSITAEIVLRLASEGIISLDDAMSDYWVDPDIKDDPRHALLTPRIALLHRTGFPNWRYQTDDVLEFMWDPDSKTGYSGEGYDYLARYLEKKTGEPFEDLAQRYVFDPIGMPQTAYTERDWFAGRLATPHSSDGEEGEPKVQAIWSAADDIYTTPREYAEFLLAVMKNEGVSPEIAAARVELIDNQFSGGCPWTPEYCPISGGFAMGWAVFEYPDETVVMQGGADWGERTIGFYVPSRKMGVAIFTNSANGGKVIKEIVDVLYQNPAFVDFLAFQAQ